MKKAALLIFIFLLNIFSIIGEENSDADYERRPALAVSKFKEIGVDRTIAESVREAITGHIIQTKKYRVIEYSQLDKILKLQKFSASDLFDRNNTIKIGKIILARGIIVGTISKIGRNYEIEARLVNLQTGEVIQGRSIRTTVQTLEFIPDECKKIAYALVDIPYTETKLSDYIVPLIEKAKNILKLSPDFSNKFHLTLASINYRETESAGSTALYIKENFENAVVNHPYYKLYPASPELLINLKHEAGRIDHVNSNGIGMLRYFDFTNYIELNFKIINPKNREILFYDKITIPKRLFPSSSTMFTDPNRLIREIQSSDSNSRDILKVTIIPGKGNGGVYKHQEKIHYFFKSNLDVYIKVLLFDGNGNVTTLLPNKFQSKNFYTKNVIHKIPDHQSSFDFEADYTGGMDVIKVVAQTEQFSDYNDVLKQVQNTGFIVDNNPGRNNVRGILTRGILTRGVRIKERVNVQVLTAEASSTMNVIR